MFYHQSAAATHRGHQISLTWLWSTRARVTDSDQLSSARFEPTAILTFGLRVRRLNHSATRSLNHSATRSQTPTAPTMQRNANITFAFDCRMVDRVSLKNCLTFDKTLKNNDDIIRLVRKWSCHRDLEVI